jgi:hypothetical protein
MRGYTKPSYRTRTKITHRFLYYIYKRTSIKFPEWRDETLHFFYELFELMEKNPALNVIVLRDDGLYIYHEQIPIVYMHFRQRHFLLHAKINYKLFNNGNKLFTLKHNGSWPRMWKVKTEKECTKLINFLKEQPKSSLKFRIGQKRSIPSWIQEFVWERDGGKCAVEGCANTDLCFDHIIPFSKGGTSNHPDNIQLLCSKHNSEKSASFKTFKELIR